MPSGSGEIRAREIQARLRQVGFAAIVDAIELARPGLAEDAEIRLYQDWIAANAAGNQHLFAAWFNLGAALGKQGDAKQAMIAYATARELNPAFYPAAINLGLALERMGQTDASLQVWESALQNDESRTTLLNHRARLMEQLGRLSDAEAILRISLLTDPAQPDAVQHWLHIRQKTCHWPILASDIPGLTPAELMRQCGPLAGLALTDDVAAQCDQAASWIARKLPPAPARLCPPEGYRHSRIRIGYLSSDFCRHAMSYLVAELFERHDRSQFEVFGYCATIDDGSEIRGRLIAAFDHHRFIRNLSDEQAAQLICDDEIDILIDLNGLTAHTRLSVLQWRPAPIQATYLGFVGPVPLPELDYLLCDDFVIPPAQASAYHPTPLPIARNYQANDSKRAIGPKLSRREAGLPDDRFVMCCFSNHYKITEAVFGAWMKILRQADQAVLWLTADDPSAQANMSRAAEQAGVAPERLLFVARTTPELYMSRLGVADLFLDTFPYNAGTVASDAIRMQLPLLTLCGASFASRMASSLLKAIGARQGITTSLEEYVAVGTMLATDEDVYARYKQYFTNDSWSTSLGDIAAFTREFEATLIRLVEKHCGHRHTPVHLQSSSDETVADAAAIELGELINQAERLNASGRSHVSIDHYERWLRHHPADPLRFVACFNYGTLLTQTDHPAQAAAALAEAVQLAPTFLPARINLGLAFEHLGRPTEAVEHWLHAANCEVPLSGDCIGHKATALRHMARVFMDRGCCAEAEEALRRSLDIDPHEHTAIWHWVGVREMQCKWPVLVPVGKLTHTDLMAALSPLALAIHSDDPLHQLANAWRSFEQDVGHLARPRTVGRWCPPAALPQRRLRIGYVSPDLREHAVGFLTAELFELHDRANVEVFAYFSGPGNPDALQARIRQSSDSWQNIVGWTDKQTARRIADDGIDILVDLGGHTRGTPTAAIALRPAPVIVNWLGYPGSMGTPHHQYIIADDTIIPPCYEKFYSERVLRLPCYQPTDRKRIVGTPPPRRDVGLPDAAFVYCCFNGSQKITPAMFRCWMMILARVPHAVLWLLSCDAATDQRLRQQAAQHGIAPERLVFAVFKPNAEHLARYGLADLFLDTFPYGAHTTASDALWMGVPVLTLAGSSFPARVCTSLVRAAGLPELVCNDRDAYADLAVALGSRPDMLSMIRDRLRAGRDRCTLFDMPLLVTRLEALYRQMWEDYLADRLPVPDLTNLAVYNAIGDELDPETTDFPDLQAYERHYAMALTYRNSLSPLVSDCRMWPGL